MDLSATSVTVWCDGCVLLVRHVQHVRGSLSLSLFLLSFSESYFKNIKSCTIAKIYLTSPSSRKGLHLHKNAYLTKHDFKKMPDSIQLWLVSLSQFHQLHVFGRPLDIFAASSMQIPGSGIPHPIGAAEVVGQQRPEHPQAVSDDHDRDTRLRGISPQLRASLEFIYSSSHVVQWRIGVSPKWWVPLQYGYFPLWLWEEGRTPVSTNVAGNGEWSLNEDVLCALKIVDAPFAMLVFQNGVQNTCTHKKKYI